MHLIHYLMVMWMWNHTHNTNAYFMCTILKRAEYVLVADRTGVGFLLIGLSANKQFEKLLLLLESQSNSETNDFNTKITAFVCIFDRMKLLLEYQNEWNQHKN